MEWHATKKEEVINELKTSKEGLKESEIQKRYAKYGKNVIKEKKKIRKITLFLKQFNSLLMWILIVSSILSFFLNHIIDGIVIGGIVLLNAIIGFFQEYKAGEIIEKLKNSLKYEVIVLREGKRKEIDSKFLVPGDIVFLEEGSRILADCRIIKTENLQINESILTGESFPVPKEETVLDIGTTLAERKNMLYAGTTVMTGKAKVVVVRTGNKTEFGKLAKLVQETKDEKMPLEKKIDSFSKKLSIAILILVGLLFAVGVAIGNDSVQMFLVSVSLAVGAIPEGLPTIIIITLAFAIKQMKKVNTLVRKLPAAETLGRATVICTDKTGTLTEEELKIDKVYSSKKLIEIKEETKIKKEFFEAIKVGILCNNAIDENDTIIGDPLDSALVRWGKMYGLNKKEITEKNVRIKEYAFSSERKMMSIIREKGKIKTSYVKGASEIILNKCTKEIINGKIHPLTKTRKHQLTEVYKEMESSGLRVLGLAYTKVTKTEQKQAEERLTFAGFVGMIDPPRKEVKTSIKHALEAGIKIKIITGDSLLTTNSIAKRIGLEGEGIEGKELEKVPDQKFDSVIRTKTIFARVTPEQKLKIVESLKKQAETVAVTGDGVNDILALKRADIGVAMGIRGSDVARDSSDIVLLDDNFASIVKAIKQGRRVFDNIKKSIMFLLSVNAANIFIIIYSILFGLPLPFLPLAILWMNIITDSIPALALALEKEEKDLMKRGPKRKGLLEEIWPTVLISGIINFAIVIGLFYWSLGRYTLETSRTMAITVSIFYAMFFILSCKSKESIIKTGIFNNKWLIYSIIFAILLHITAIYTLLGKIFEFVPLNTEQIIITIALGIIGLIFFETKKMIKNT